MTDKETRAWLHKNKWKQPTREYKRRNKLKMWYKDRIDEEIARTAEKLMMLCSIKIELQRQ